MSSSPYDLAPLALEFAVQCHTGHRRASDGEPFITHPLEVARLLRDAGCSETVVAAGLLHDIVEDTDVEIGEIAERFGERVATLVQGVTDNSSIGGYRQRKQVLRDHIRFIGGDVALVFAADKISKVREWPRRVGRERVRLQELSVDSRARRCLEQHQEACLEHYRESLAMLERVAPGHPLVSQLADELARCTSAVAADPVTGTQL